jgi:asparagine synthase (glutamine-hydrolysing)
LTAIYGLARFDGGAVEASEMDAMALAIRYWGPDREGTWRSPDARIGLGQVISHNLPESFREEGPVKLPDGSVVTCAARLDNRDELRSMLRLPAEVTESQIVAAAWDRWRTDAPLHLFGDWSFAAWDAAARRLFLARDHFGNTALYHFRNRSTFAFASSRKALFALPMVPRRLNELRLAQHLATWVTDGEATFHDEIFRLPPGHHLLASADGNRITRYWLPEDAPEVRFSNDDDYVARFLELYSRAVEVRTRTTKTIIGTLSSGLDSGSVTALAARAMRGSGKKLTVYTSVPMHREISTLLPGVLVDEWPMADAVARWIGDIDHRALPAEGASPLGSMELSLWIHVEPEYAASNLFWIIDLLEKSREMGAGVLLTGQLGNGGVSWGGDQQRVLRGVLQGNWLDAWRGLREYQQLRKTSFPRALSSQVVRPLRGRMASWRFRRGLSTVPHAIALFSTSFLERLALFDRMREEKYDPFYSAVLPPREQRFRFLLPRINPIGALWDESGAAYGLEVRDPTGDVRLLEYCLGVPDDQYVRTGRDRYLIRRSLEGLVPPAVQWSQQRGRQGADLVFRLRDDAVVVNAAIEEVTASVTVRDYINVDLIHRSWRSVVEGDARNAFPAASMLARTLLISLFLAREPFGGRESLSLV